MIDPATLCVAGTVNKTHGIAGELSMSFSFDGFDVVVCRDSCMFFDIDGIFVPFFVETVRSRGAGSLLVKLDGEDSQEQASAFVGKDIYLPMALIPEAEDDDDVVYVEKLIGYTAVDTNGKIIGRIADYDDSTENALFIIEETDTGKKILIPIVDDFIDEIDAEGMRVVFDIPQQLLEL